MTPTRRLAPTVTSLANRTILHLLILGLERAYKKRAYKHVLWDILAIGLSSTKSLPSTIFVFVCEVQGFAQSFVANCKSYGAGLHMFWKTRRGLSNKTTRESLLVNKEFCWLCGNLLLIYLSPLKKRNKGISPSNIAKKFNFKVYGNSLKVIFIRATQSTERKIIPRWP